MEFLTVIIAKTGPRLADPKFIATFLLFTLLIWISMSGDDRDPFPSFLKAGLIAFAATFVLFAIVTP